MPIIDDREILKNLQEQNSWWVFGKIDEDLAPSFHRNEYERVKFIFNNDIRRFPLLSGPRRVGKSTIMFQIIDELLKGGVNPSRILFYTLDDFPNTEVKVKDAVRVYNKFIYSGNDFYLFIDEAQKDKSWKDFAKQLFDLNKKVKVMISGSSSIELENASNESGAARFITIKIPTFSFYEFCELNSKRVDVPDVDVFKLHELSLEEQTSIYMKLSCLYKDFIKYLKIGGFPEYSKSEQYSYISKLIRDQVVTKAIRQDIPNDFHINDIDALSNLYSYFCYHTSEIVNVSVIAKELEIDRATCNQYIDALKKANLIYISDQFNIDGKKSLKPRKKIYVSDYGIRCAVTRNNDVETDETELGYAIETVSYKHTLDYFLSIDEELYSVGYLRSDKDKEIDIVIKKNGKDIQYIETKYRKHSHIKDSDGILSYGLKNVPGYVVSKELDDFGLVKRGETALYRIPALAYAYLLGKNKK